MIFDLCVLSQDIAKMMSGWTQQMGFPLITVKEVKREAGSVKRGNRGRTVGSMV